MDEQLAGSVGHDPVVELLGGDDEIGFPFLPERDGLFFIFEDSLEIDFFYRLEACEK